MGQEYRNFANNILVGASVVTVTSPFGLRTYKNAKGETVTNFHYGIDMLPVTLIKAPADGVVESIVTDETSGLILTMRHGNGYETVYKHLKTDSIAHKINEFVEKNRIIATGGGTGTAVTGPHEHYEVRINGKAVDPLPYLIGTKVIPPYVLKPTDLVSRPELPMLRIKVVSNIRADASVKALDIGDTVIGVEYSYLGKTAVIDSFEWARIDYHGTIGYVALNSAWNEVVLPPERYKTFEAELQKEGMVLSVSLKPVTK